MLDAAMLKPLTETFAANVTTLVPIGITIMGTMLGVTIIPRIIYKFF